MTDIERYTKVFKDSFEVSEDEAKTLKYQDVPLWDSVGHMDMIASLEDEFNITMTPDDIIEFSSYQKGMELLQAHYGIKF